MSENVVYVDVDLEDLIPDFLDHRNQDVERIRNLLEQGDLREIQRLGHSMKGAGGGYGFDKITEIGRGIEEAAKTGDKNKIEKLNADLARYLSEIEIVYQEE